MTVWPENLEHHRAEARVFFPFSAFLPFSISIPFLHLLSPNPFHSFPPLPRFLFTHSTEFAERVHSRVSAKSCSYSRTRSFFFVRIIKKEKKHSWMNAPFIPRDKREKSGRFRLVAWPERLTREIEPSYRALCAIR